jgi:ribulose-5-phosphate 4-epimerase/fuculose-1-phosphate aldolase
MAGAPVAAVDDRQAEQQAREALVTACHILANEGITEAAFNVSARLPGGRMMAHPITSPTLVTVDNIVVYEPGAKLSEYKAHPAIYAARPDVGAIVHAHPPYTIAFGTLGEEFKPIHHYGTPFHGKIATYDSPGQTKSEDRAGDIARALGTGCALLQQGHGVITVGKDLKEALLLALYLEESFKILAITRQMGGKPKEFSLQESEMISQQILKQRSQDKAWLHYADKLRVSAGRPSFSDRMTSLRSVTA